MFMKTKINLNPNNLMKNKYKNNNTFIWKIHYIDLSFLMFFIWLIKFEVNMCLIRYDFSWSKNILPWLQFLIFEAWMSDSSRSILFTCQNMVEIKFYVRISNIEIYNQIRALLYFTKHHDIILYLYIKFI